MPATPRYETIKRLVMDRIATGDWGPDDRIPSEHELVRSTGAARMTVNRALRELTGQGVLYRVPGVGTFVAPAQLQHPAARVREIRDEIETRGRRHDASVLALEEITGEFEIAAALRLPVTAALFRSLILHCADGEPILLEERWVNPAVAPAYLTVDFTRTTPTRYLLAQAPLQRLEQRIAAVAAAGPVAEQLALAAGAPVLLITRRTWSRDEAASLARLHYAGDRYQLDQGADDLPPFQPGETS